MRYKQIFLVVLLVLAIVLPRAIGNDRTVTVDEWTWVSFSANFYYALGQREFDQTYQDHHPGVTTMLAGASAMHLLFPEYRGLGQGYTHAMALVDILEANQIDPLNLLVLSRSFMVAAVCVTLFASFYFLSKSVAFLPAFFGILLIALDPYHIGHSRLLTQDGLMAVLIMLSFILFYEYYRDPKIWVLILSGVAGGAALLTKITAGIFLPFFLLVSLTYSIQRQRSSEDTVLRNGLWHNFWRPLILWAVVVLVVVFILWPGMWVDPLGMLSAVFGKGFEVFGNKTFAVESAKTSGIAAGLGRGFVYLKSYFQRSSLVSWLGLMTLPIIFFIKKENEYFNLSKKLLAFILPGFIWFSMVMGIVGEKVVPHYNVSAHVWGNLAAGIGLGLIANWLADYSKRFGKYVWALILFVVGVSNLSGIFWSFPYYLVYHNPLFKAEEVGGMAYGVLLDEAGRYLAEKPDAVEQTVMSYYGISSFSFFYPGETIHLFTTPKWSEKEVRNLEKCDYLVIYRNQWTWNRVPPALMDSLEGVPIEKSIVFDDYEYVRIYRVSDLPPEVFVPDPNYD